MPVQRESWCHLSGLVGQRHVCGGRVQRGSVRKQAVDWFRHQCCWRNQWHIDNCRRTSRGHDSVVACPLLGSCRPYFNNAFVAVNRRPFAPGTVPQYCYSERRRGQARAEISATDRIVHVRSIIRNAIWACRIQHRAPHLLASRDIV